MWSLGWEDALEKGTAPPPVLLPGESHGEEPGRLQSTGSQDSDTTEVTEHEIKEDEGKIERKTREKRRRKQTQLWSHQTRLEIVRAEAAAAGALVAGIY